MDVSDTGGQKGTEAAADVGAGFALVGEPSSRRLTKAMLEGWAKLYGREPRQMRRWCEEGAPMDDPEAMPIWWENERAAGRKSWGVPDGVLAAAEAARVKRLDVAAPAAAEAAAVPTAGVGPGAPPAGGPVPGALTTSAKPINIEDFDPDEGDRLRELKQIQSARFAQLREALAAGHDTTMLEAKYVKLCETVDKMESRVTERLKKRGLFILRPEVERDVAKAAEMIRQMGESEVRRVLELVPDLPPAFRDQVAAAIRKVTQARAGVFRTMKSMKGVEDAVLQLSAA